MTIKSKNQRSTKKHNDPMNISLDEFYSSSADSGFKWWPALLLIVGLGLVFVLLVNHSPKRKAVAGMENTGGFAIPAAAEVGGGLGVDERRDLLHMVEEEKLARDVYHFLHGKWGLSQFNSIARSEEHHVNAVLSLIQKYGLPDPITGSRSGVFQDVNFAKLYNDLIRKGNRSAVDALMVGGLIEELDIIDLEKAIKVARQSDIQQVYKQIQRGSFNHLRSFAHALELVGKPYQPAKLSKGSFDNIVHSPMVSGF
jgi:hypothetical protein